MERGYGLGGGEAGTGVWTLAQSHLLPSSGTWVGSKRGVEKWGAHVPWNIWKGTAVGLAISCYEQYPATQG